MARYLALVLDLETTVCFLADQEIVRVAGPIGVREAVEGEGAFGIMKAKIEGAFEVTKNPFS